MADPVDRRTRIRRRSERITRIVERAALGLLVVLYLVGFDANGDQAADIEREGKDRAQQIQREADSRAAQLKEESDARTAQFCRLINSTHADRKRRYRTTVRFLRSPAGLEQTLFNEYIRRVSLPQTRQEIRVESKRIPPVCRHP